MAGKNILFYQYRPLTSLEHIEHFQNFINKKIWFTKLDDFNDPFEGMFISEYPSPEQIIKTPATFERYYQYIVKNNPSVTRESFRSELMKPEAKEMIGGQSIICELFRSCGAASFTKSGSNIPMWAHYAKNHQGYCVVLEFDLDILYELMIKDRPKISRDWFDEYLNNIIDPPAGEKPEILPFRQSRDSDKKVMLTKIAYSEDLPSMNEIALDTLPSSLQDGPYERNKYLINNSIGVKFKQWEYEQEYRLIVNTNSKTSGLMDLKGFQFLRIAGIIMGENIGKSLDEDAIKFIKNAESSEIKRTFNNDIEQKLMNYIAKSCQRSNIKTYLASCSKDSYAISWNPYEYMPTQA